MSGLFSAGEDCRSRVSGTGLVKGWSLGIKSRSRELGLSFVKFRDWDLLFMEVVGGWCRFTFLLFLCLKVVLRGCCRGDERDDGSGLDGGCSVDI